MKNQISEVIFFKKTINELGLNLNQKIQLCASHNQGRVGFHVTSETPVSWLLEEIESMARMPTLPFLPKR